ncbi:hypothetical protein PanWU01x14_324060 [Parasponia andersonii]|uniref:Uncharacterized protein n=1 Tax=Parasponia andersonii TaxID=3476 RepID=A0A2P5AK87_PARAD|nr:hypothetical protein PanWU01x14_324060 [Parasponia andersonii]
MELATFSLPAGRFAQCGRLVHAFCAPRPSCLGCAHVFHAHVHHVCFTRPLFHFRPVPMELGRGRPAAHVGQSWPRSVDHVSAFLGHSPRLVPRRSMTLASLSERPPKRPDVSHACLYALIMRTRRCLGCAHVPLARARAMLRTHILMKPSVGRTYVSHPHVCLGVPPTLCACLAHLPCMLRITSAMHLLAANKSCHAFPPRHGCVLARASLHMGPIRVYKGLTNPPPPNEADVLVGRVSK